MSENVWDYPRPPRLEPCKRRARVEFGGQTIADSSRALRVLETSHPPVIYIPAEDFVAGALVPSDSSSTFCEFKGVADYLDVSAGGKVAEAAAWTYPRPPLTRLQPWRPRVVPNVLTHRSAQTTKRACCPISASLI